MKRENFSPGQRHLLSFVLFKNILAKKNLAILPKRSLSTSVSVSGIFAVILLGLALPQRGLASDLTRQLHNPNSVRNTPFTSPFMGREARNDADAWVRNAQEYMRQGDPLKALDAIAPALEVYHHQGDLRAQGTVYEIMGQAYVAIGRYKEAENAIRTRLGIARDVGDLRSQVFALNNIGTFLLHHGEADTDAREAFSEALVIAKRIQSIEGQGLSLSNLGLASARLGEHNKAIKYYEQALDYRWLINDPVGRATTHNSLGDAHFATGNYHKSTVAYGTAMRLAKRGGDRVNELRAIDGLITAHASVEQYELAFQLLGQRLEIAQQMRNLPEQLVSYEAYGRMYERVGNYRTARNFYQQAVVIARNLEDSRKEVQILDRLTQIRGKK